jgi:hypothetical protein
MWISKKIKSVPLWLQSSRQTVPPVCHGKPVSDDLQGFINCYSSEKTTIKTNKGLLRLKVDKL